MYYVYSLKCRDGYYVDYTDNIKERLERDQKGQVPVTANRLPVSGVAEVLTGTQAQVEQITLA